MKRSAGKSSRNSGKHRIVECPSCGKSFRSDVLNRHMKTHNDSYECRYCKKLVRSDLLLRHETLCKDKVDETLCNRNDCSWLETDLECSSVKGCFRIYNIDVENSLDYDEILSNVTHHDQHIPTRFGNCPSD